MALVLTEFEGDDDAVQELASVIRDEPQYFDHIAQKLRDDRESKAQLSALIEELIARGKPSLKTPDTTPTRRTCTSRRRTGQTGIRPRTRTPTPTSSAPTIRASTKPSPSSATGRN
jgi:hypothetical protein